MGQFFDEIPPQLIKWIKEQKIFWVATAPLSEHGHVNVSPKGYVGSFRIIDGTKVWYEDLSGSGAETIAHLRENKRITILFQAFEGPPRIARIFGTGTFYEFGTPEYEALLPLEERQAGSRSVIMVDVHKVGTACGFTIPFFDYKCERMKSKNISAMMELRDIKHEAECSKLPEDESKPKGNGLKIFWGTYNKKSIDGLPALESAFESPVMFKREEWEVNRGKDDESIGGKRKVALPEKVQVESASAVMDAGKRNDYIVIGFMLGMAASAVVIWLKRMLEGV